VMISRMSFTYGLGDYRYCKKARIRETVS
jgi:hypothetical protein